MDCICIREAFDRKSKLFYDNVSILLDTSPPLIINIFRIILDNFVHIKNNIT